MLALLMLGTGNSASYEETSKQTWNDRLPITPRAVCNL